MAAIGDTFRVMTNVGTLNALNRYKNNNEHLQKLQEQTATGKRLNEYADDPAYSKISDSLTARSRGIAAALTNVATARNFLSIAEGGLLQIQNILLTVKEEITRAADDVNGPHERDASSQTIASLLGDVDDTVNETIGGDRRLLDGSYINISYQIGESTTSTLKFSLDQAHTRAGLGIDAPNMSDLVFTAAGAAVALTNIDTAIETVSGSLEKIGAIVNRLNFQETTLSIDMIGTQAINSRLSDTDMAQNQLDASRHVILQRASTSQLTQANASPMHVLMLFV